MLLYHPNLKETNDTAPDHNDPGTAVESEARALTDESGKTQDGTKKFTNLNFHEGFANSAMVDIMHHATKDQ